MNYEIIKELEKELLKENAPQFSVGDTVRVHNRIKEGNRERIQIFEGTVLKIQGGGPRTTFTVRKESSGIGVEKTWPLHSPNVEKVDVVRRGKARFMVCRAVKAVRHFVIHSAPWKKLKIRGGELARRNVFEYYGN